MTFEVLRINYDLCARDDNTVKKIYVIVLQRAQGINRGPKLVGFTSKKLLYWESLFHPIWFCLQALADV